MCRCCGLLGGILYEKLAHDLFDLVTRDRWRWEGLGNLRSECVQIRSRLLPVATLIDPSLISLMATAIVVVAVIRAVAVSSADDALLRC